MIQRMQGCLTPAVFNRQLHYLCSSYAGVVELAATTSISRFNQCVIRQYGKGLNGQSQLEDFVASHDSVKAGPLRTYLDNVKSGAFRQDSSQESSILQLQELYERFKKKLPLLRKERKPKVVSAGAWDTIFSADPQQQKTMPKPICKGLYMYGGVGVGKTMLMDLIADSVQADGVSVNRIHFNAFMLGVHSALRNFQRKQDPLTLVADDYVKSCSLLCLDEFQVTDVADAMMLNRLFSALWDRGLVLVATSNRMPRDLYKNGLNRQRFLPFIGRLEQQCVVHDMDSSTDHRTLARGTEGLYFEGANAKWELEEMVQKLGGSRDAGINVQAGGSSVVVPVAMGRELTVQRTVGNVAVMSYEELCGKALGSADYIALCQHFHTVAVTGVPVVSADNKEMAYRFVNLVDVAYDQRVLMLMSAASNPSGLFQHVISNQDSKRLPQSQQSLSSNLVVDDLLAFTKDRTVSRLIDMQSVEYQVAHAEKYEPGLLLALQEAMKREGGGRQSASA